MWKKLFILVMVLITSLCAWSADGDTFQAETPGGVMMKFMVISEAEKTCAVASYAIDHEQMMMRLEQKQIIISKERIV